MHPICGSGVRLCWLFPCAALIIATLSPGLVHAELVRWEVTSRVPYADGREFGTAGAYEKVTGRVHFEIDPALPQNQDIVDLTKAPRNARHKVEFWSDLVILAPKDPLRGNGAVLYDVNNRGNKLALGFFNQGDPGDGFLMRHGFTVVWSGWDGELLPGNDRLRLSPPVARDGENRITGLVRCEITLNSRVTRTVINWDNHGSYRPVADNFKEATLTVRERPDDPRQPIPRDQFQLHLTNVESDSPSQLPKVELEYPQGLKPGWIYEVIYMAQDPLVHGVCFASVRDLIAALKQGGGENYPFVQSPSENSSKPVLFRRALGFGVSQSGRFLREFLHAGFNQDEQGKIVFDGLMPHVAGGGLGSFNHRFAQPTRHVNQHDHHDYPGDRFPFTYGVMTDPLSGQTDGILKRAVATGTVPKVMHTQSAGEYYTRSGSLVHTDPLGQLDAEIPPSVRIYALGGTQHGPAGWPPSKSVGKYFNNPGDYKPVLRALLLSLDRWIEQGHEPPLSAYPRLDQGTLVRLEQAGQSFPKIPLVEFPRIMQTPPLLDLGPRWYSDRIVELQPPRQIGMYQARVPKPGRDGNETAGTLLPPDVGVPLGTHTGWNLRRQDVGAENDLVSLGGAFIPFAKTHQDREFSGDPRLSLMERYGSLQGYLDQLQAYCQTMEKQGYLLSEDIPRVIQVQKQRATLMFSPASE